MRHSLFALPVLLFCLAANAAEMRRDAAVGENLRAPLLEELELRAAWAEILDGLRLEFFDPATEQTFTAHGPFELVLEAGDRIEVLASSDAGQVAPELTLVQTLDGIWAVARFAEREFATRIE